MFGVAGPAATPAQPGPRWSVRQMKSATDAEFGPNNEPMPAKSRRHGHDASSAPTLQTTAPSPVNPGSFNSAVPRIDSGPPEMKSVWPEAFSKSRLSTQPTDPALSLIHISEPT